MKRLLIDVVAFAFPTPAAATAVVGVAAILAVHACSNALTAVAAMSSVLLASALADVFWPSDTEG